jgi:uridine kinase
LESGPTAKSFPYNEAMLVDDLAATIQRLPQPPRGPVIVAIDGYGGAGKSTLAFALAKRLGPYTAVVAIDDFFLAEVVSDADKINFDRERLRREALEPARAGRSIAYRRNDDVGPTTEIVTIDVPIEYLIVEGVSSLHPELTTLTDYRIWIETPAEQARQRMETRDRSLGADHGPLWEQWTESYSAYVERHNPRQRAHVAISVTALS